MARLSSAAAIAILMLAASDAGAARDDAAEAPEKEEEEEEEKEEEKDRPPPPAGGDACIDEDVKADLFAKRRQRTSRERLFQQTNRHELTVRGGYYVSDLFDGTYTVGGAYAYHMTEDLAVEASGAYTQLTSAGGPELERTFRVLENRPRRSLLFDADLVWAPAHAKMRLGGSITHFDFYLVAGAGVVDSVLSNNVAGNAGFGFKFFLGRALALRIDLRDHVYRQQLLSQTILVNDISATLGLSVYLPIRE